MLKKYPKLTLTSVECLRSIYFLIFAWVKFMCSFSPEVLVSKKCGQQKLLTGVRKRKFPAEKTSTKKKKI